MLKIIPLLLAAITFLTFSDASAAVTIKNLGLPSGFTTIYDGIGSSSDGTVYIGVGNHTNNAMFLRYDPARDSLIPLGNVAAVSTAANNWKTGDNPGKIHTKIYEHSDGRMYFGTHSANEGDSAWYAANFRGGHIYSWDPSANLLRDVNAGAGTPDVAIPHQGVMDVAIDRGRGQIYTIGYPNGHLYRHTLATGSDSLIYRTGQSNGGVTRHLMIDNTGRVFLVNGQILEWFNPLTGTVVRKTAANKYIVIPERTTGSPHLEAVLYSPSRDSIYFSILDEPHIYRFIPSRDTIEVIAGEATRAMAGRFDIGKVLWVAGTQLKLHDINTRTTTILSSSMPSNCDGCGGTDRNGNLFFGVNYAGYFIRVSIGIPVSVSDYSVSAPPDGRGSLSLRVSPNPFYSRTTITIRDGGNNISGAAINIFTPQGILVRSWDSRQALFSGITVDWDASHLAAGVYLVAVKTGRNILTRKITLVK